MSDDNGGPRIWNRAEVRRVFCFANNSKLGLGDIDKALDLMEYIEKFSLHGPTKRSAAGAPKPWLAAASAGGKARSANMTPERRSEIASIAAKARWNGAKPVPAPPELRQF